MNKPKLLGIVAFSGLAAIVSCDSGTGGTSNGLDANDCPVGTFRPIGLTDCVFPAVDLNGQPIGVSDNRCAFGQPAVPPQCVSDAGGRPYLSASMTCATGYRYLPGACNRNNGTAGDFGTGFGTGVGGSFGAAGAAGSFEQGFGGDNGTAGTTGAAGSMIPGNPLGEAGAGAAGAPVTGSGGTGETAGMNGQSASDASSDAS
jgi:hypothetical protein